MLFWVIVGEEVLEGEVVKVYLYKDVCIGFLNQDFEFFEEYIILEVVLDLDNVMIQAVWVYEYVMFFLDDIEAMYKVIVKMDVLKVWDFEVCIWEVLIKLEVSDLNKLVKNFFGGQKKCLALVKFIIEELEFFIFDELINYFDFDMIEWLEEYLQQFCIILFMVIYDCYFLEWVCDIIVELDLGKFYCYIGNYSEFLEKKMICYDVEFVILEKSKKLFKWELDWVCCMFKVWGIKVKFWVDVFYDLKDEVLQQCIDEEMKIDIKGQCMGKKVLEVYNISKAYDDKVLVDGFIYKF